MSIIVDGKLQKNTSYSGIQTVVRSIRAEKSFFDDCKNVAKQEGITCNELIVREVYNYLSKQGGRYGNND